MNVSHCRVCTCKSFIPQYWKDNKCKDCFHLILEHTDPGDDHVGSNVRSFKRSNTVENLPVDKKRDRIVQEILQTEKNYVENVSIMIDCFVIPLRNLPHDIAPRDQLGLIFSNIEEIRPINQMLLADLQKRIDGWSPSQKIGDVFVKLIPFLKTYTKYTAGYASSIAALKEGEKNTIFATALKKLAADDKCKKLDLRSYLIQPIQRIPRYNLLLEDLIKNTDKTHPDFDDLQHSLSQMKEIANVINEAIRINENRIKVVEIQSTFFNPIQDLVLVEPHRMFVREGELTKVCRKAPKRFQFVLFSDLLIYGSQVPGDKFLFHRSIKLETCRLEGMADSDQVHNAFLIGSAQKSFIVFADNPQQKEEWMSDMRDQIQQLITKRESFRGSVISALEKHAEAPIWIPDHISPKCALCEDLFTFFVRRHHCRACGGVVCGSCSDKKVLIPSIDTKKTVRVCDKCFKDKKVNTIYSLRSTSQSVMTL